jgi:nucleotide-binding universal stress UspA family protein
MNHAGEPPALPRNIPQEARMKIDKILWGSDGSSDSEHALKVAEILARKFKSKITGVSVIPEYYSVVNVFPPAEKAKFKDWIDLNLIEGKKESMDKLKRELSKKGIEYDYEILKGIPSKALRTRAEKDGADLIVLGRGRLPEQTILGGTALKVLRTSKIPVLTVRGDKVKTGIKRILVPVELSHGMSRSFDYALGLARELGSELHVLNVVEIGYHKFPIELSEQMRGFAHRELIDTVGKSRIGETIEVHTVTAPNGWRGIVDFAVKNKTDMIVMMSYGGGKFKREFIGSVSEKVIQESPCPVITLTP